jgi:ABC-type lipoprotein release transport system permease subunit
VNQSLRVFLFGVQPSDFATDVLVALVIVAVALAACIVPARRAAQFDPAAVLRDE